MENRHLGVDPSLTATRDHETVQSDKSSSKPAILRIVRAALKYPTQLSLVFSAPKRARREQGFEVGQVTFVGQGCIGDVSAFISRHPAVIANRTVSNLVWPTPPSTAPITHSTLLQPWRLRANPQPSLSTVSGTSLRICTSVSRAPEPVWLSRDCGPSSWELTSRDYMGSPKIHPLDNIHLESITTVSGFAR
jgi:hypothetical protein